MLQRVDRSASLPINRNIPTVCRIATRALTGVFLLVALVAISGLSGCSRSFWRRNAEENAYDVLGEKITDPRWTSPRLDITPD